MSFLLIVFSLLQSLILIGSSGDSTTIKLRPIFFKGEIKNYKVIKESIVLDRENIIINDKIEKDISITVLDYSDTLIKLEWEVNKIEIMENIPQDNPLSIFIVSIDHGLKIKYQLDKYGRMQRVNNYNEIKSAINEKIDNFITYLKNDAYYDNQYISLLEFQLKITYSTMEQINKLVLFDLFRYYCLYGNEYQLNESEQVLMACREYGIEDTVHVIGSKYLEEKIISFKITKSTSELHDKFLAVYQFHLDDKWIKQVNSEFRTNEIIEIIEYYTILEN